MSTALKSILLSAFLVGLFADSVTAQQRRKTSAPRKATTGKNVQTEAAESANEQSPEKAAAFFEEGQTAHQAGKLAEAVRLYGEALKQDKTLWQAEYQRATAYFSLGRLSEARAGILRVTELLKEYPESTEMRDVSARLHWTLGEILTAEGNLADAEAAFKQALIFKPDSVRARAGLAQIFFTRGNFAEAASEAQAAIKAGDDRVSTLVLLGVAQVSGRNYDDALSTLTEALKREPQQSAALRYRAEVFLARKNYEQAAADLQASLTTEKNAATLLRLAEIYLQAGRSDEAVKLAKQALEADPANAAAKNLIASATIESGDAAQAIPQLEAMVKAEPNRADVRAKLAEKYLPTQPDKALEQSMKAAELEPNNLKHQLGVGSALVKLKRFPEAAETMRRILAQNPPVELAYFAHTNLATALFEQDDYANAAREYVWILRNQNEQKKTAVTLFLLGICFDKLGDFEQALKAYEQFLKIAPPENQLEIDKVKLRMEPLKRQLEKAGGKKKK